MSALVVEALGKQGLCELCTNVLTCGFDPDNDSLPIQLHTTSGNVYRPDLDVIRKNSMEGCRLCSELLYIFGTKVVNGYEGITREEDVQQAIEVVALKYKRISVDMVFDDEQEPPYYTLVYNFKYNEDDDQEDDEVEIDATDIESGSDTIEDGSGPGTQDPELDSEAFLQVIFFILGTTYAQHVLLPESPMMPPSNSTSSEESWACCTSWLDHCTTSHVACNSLLSPNRTLPKRLIDVGTEDSPPFLCLSSSLPLSTQYITLSHCWGKTKVMTLTSGTNAALSSQIPMEDLSETFQDAITITRRLYTKYGVRHLWIDSLCILQDSEEEWLAEAPRMAEVYGNCWCNIAATGDGCSLIQSGGMFSLRDPKKLEPLILSVSQGSSKTSNFTCFGVERWSDFVRNSRLNKRAWVCQERLLSPRILHFGANEVFWECSICRASETFPAGEPFINYYNNGASETLVRAQSKITTIAEAREAWLDIVAVFTMGALTLTSDKLFAISGLARVFQEKFDGSDYLAGIWRADLERQLLWRVEGMGIASRSSDYRAPSWCWTSIDGPIFSGWAPADGDILIKTLDVSIALGGDDSFGAVIAGALRIQCRLLKASPARDTHYFPGLRLSIDRGFNEIAFHSDEYISPESDMDQSLYAVPVSLQEAIYDDGKGFILQGLVLEATGVVRGQYRRVGAFTTTITEEVEAIIQQTPPELAELEYEAFDGGDQYTIYII